MNKQRGFKRGLNFEIVIETVRENVQIMANVWEY